ncbi:TM2 domain protein [Candidatus Moduliflexus flocculans]|uniref:TM2 domain protein n=1 Tax=Candidatus Moduliflexus flocculans TaxID=1499966 RepID=A0A081BMI7_9BACT|nr:TM2 domain protein [Candidatus Moduliflexus flocculans]
MKSSGIAYVLWCAGLFGGCGIHRIYLGKYGTGLLYLFTFGLFGIGQFIDLFRIPGMVERENLKEQLRQGATVNVNIHGAAGAANVVVEHRQTAQAVPPPLPQTKEEPETGKALEAKILRLARNFHGRLTPLELAANSSLSLEEADNVLENIVRRGYANMEVSDAGSIVYEFPGFLELNPPKRNELDEYETI